MLLHCRMHIRFRLPRKTEKFKSVGRYWRLGGIVHEEGMKLLWPCPPLCTIKATVVHLLPQFLCPYSKKKKSSTYKNVKYATQQTEGSVVFYIHVTHLDGSSLWFFCLQPSSQRELCDEQFQCFGQHHGHFSTDHLMENTEWKATKKGVR